LRSPVTGSDSSSFVKPGRLVTPRHHRLVVALELDQVGRRGGRAQLRQPRAERIRIRSAAWARVSTPVSSAWPRVQGDARSSVSAPIEATRPAV